MSKSPKLQSGQEDGIKAFNYLLGRAAYVIHRTSHEFPHWIKSTFQALDELGQDIFLKGYEEAQRDDLPNIHKK